MLRRVQPDLHRGAVRGVDAVQVHLGRHPLQRHTDELHGGGHQADLDERRLHHHEPGIRGPHGAPREPQGVVPPGGDDRARSAVHLREHAHVRGLHQGAAVGQQVRAALLLVQGAALETDALRLGPPRREVVAPTGGDVEEDGAGERRESGALPCPPRLQHTEDHDFGHAHLLALDPGFVSRRLAGPLLRPGVLDGLRGHGQEARPAGGPAVHHQGRRHVGHPRRAALHVHHRAHRLREDRDVEDALGCAQGGRRGRRVGAGESQGGDIRRVVRHDVQDQGVEGRAHRRDLPQHEQGDERVQVVAHPQVGHPRW
mmetsp:Transcript_4516/g.13035  ORF Transcript_4516/g.13035 Transcript_4516/m.13035 type:complete len:314 (+) Transcript_4516:5817-6758(+)